MLDVLGVGVGHLGEEAVWEASSIVLRVSSNCSSVTMRPSSRLDSKKIHYNTNKNILYE